MKWGLVAVQTAPALGVAQAASSLSNGDLFGWLVEPHHAWAVLIGLLGGFAFRLTVVVHEHGMKKVGREVAMMGFAFMANFWLAVGVTQTFATAQPPRYLFIVLLSIAIAASGTTLLQISLKRIQRFIPGLLKLLLGGNDGKEG